MAATERGGKNRGKQKNDTETLILGRMPPQNIEAEMAVLGAMLLDKDAIEVAENMLHPEDFYREQDAIIYQAVLNLSRAGKSADILTVTEELRRMGRLDDVGGIMYVNELPEHVITTKGIERHVDIVSGKAKLRRLIDTAGDIAEAAYTEENTVEEIVDDAERAILQVAREQNVKGFTPVGEAVQHTLEDITRKYQNHELITGLATGFAKLDAFTNGFQKGNLIIVAARPSMGKTAIVLNMAKNMSLSSARKTVAFFSLEMGRDELVQRLLSSTALIEGQRLKTGRINTEQEWKNLSSAVSVFMEAPLYIDDTPAVTVAQIRARCRRLKAEHGLDAVMIDYLQLMTSRNVRNNDSRQQEISEISRSLKSWQENWKCLLSPCPSFPVDLTQDRTTVPCSPICANPALSNRMRIWSAFSIARLTITRKLKKEIPGRMKRNSFWLKTETVLWELSKCFLPGSIHFSMRRRIRKRRRMWNKAPA